MIVCCVNLDRIVCPWSWYNFVAWIRVTDSGWELQGKTKEQFCHNSFAVSSGVQLNVPCTSFSGKSWDKTFDLCSECQAFATSVEMQSHAMPFADLVVISESERPQKFHFQTSLLHLVSKCVALQHRYCSADSGKSVDIYKSCLEMKCTTDKKLSSRFHTLL
jgi:hypothetical protein